MPATYAGGGVCSGAGKAFVTSGNDNRFEGTIHSNLDVNDSGSSNVATGAKTRTGAVVQNNGLWTGATAVAAQSWPINPALVTTALYSSTGTRGQLAAGGWHYSASSFDLSGNVPAGIYYATGSGGIKLTNVIIVPRVVGGVTRSGATFVATSGRVELSGDNSTLVPFESDPDRIVILGGWQDYDSIRVAVIPRP